MKNYEKLGLKSASYRASTGNENLNKALADVHSYGFEMGFLKAKEMIKKELLGLSYIRTPIPIGEMIDKIGEEEV